ncbi:vomeronasal type-1 receptor 4-like [Erethizon dorsatum]
MAFFGLKYFFNDIVCKCLSYIERVGRGVSISTICLLSVFQNIIISSMNSYWKDVKVIGTIYIALVVFPEVCFSLIIVWASSSMIFILYRHKHRVQHIHVTNVSLRSPESRATHSILFLVSTFISFYTVSSIIRISITLAYNLSFWLDKHFKAGSFLQCFSCGTSGPHSDETNPPKEPSSY